MRRLKNHAIEGSRKRRMVMDIYWPDEVEEMPLVIFAHGYKGFKDWGPWHLMAEKFTQAGMVYIPFNFSFNGGTKDNPIDFPDLEAFAENNYTTELNDLKMLINWASTTNVLPKGRMTSEIYLIGHSRGGGIVTLCAAEDERITKLSTWAGVSDFASRWPKKEELKDWKETGVRTVLNSRTQQNMPLNYQFYQDWEKNKERLDIPKAAKTVSQPWLVATGDMDAQVLIKEARSLKRRGQNTKMLTLKGGNHTFGGKHPWASEKMPDDLEQLTEGTIAFFKSS